MSITQELLNLTFTDWSDKTLRHTLFVKNASLSDQVIPYTTLKTVYFNGLSYLVLQDNQQDWLLGSSINDNRLTSKNWTPTDSSDEFTFDCWIYPLSGGAKYYPIISSFKDIWFNNSRFNLGWVLQLNTQSQKLQLISYMFGDCTNRVIESTTSVAMDQWTHIALMAWKLDTFTLKYFFVNGVADGGISSVNRVQNNKLYAYQNSNFPISNIISHKAYNGLEGDPDYSPVYIGLGPKTKFTDPLIDDSFCFTTRGYKFYGYLGPIRIGLGTRYSTSGLSFNPYEDFITPSITSTTSTTSTITTSTTTTLSERGEIPLVINQNDLLALKLRNNLSDLTNRHYIKPIGDTNFALTELGCKSLSFTGNNYLIAQLNSRDFSLGSTLLVNRYDSLQPICENNNQFSLEFWLKAMPTSKRYLGICGSFSKDFFPVDLGDTISFSGITARRDYQIGWSLLLDTEIHKLLLVNYAFGRALGSISSTLTVPNNQWVHVAFMATTNNGVSGLKFLFINGQSDDGNPYNNESVAITNGVHRGSVTTFIDSHAPLFIGMAADPFVNDMLDYQNASTFEGNLSSFRLSSNTRYPTDGTGFIPDHLVEIITITTSTTQTSTITTETTTTQFFGYLSVEGSVTTNNDTNASNWVQFTCS